MSIENDETLQLYIEESIEHLSDIENDFLAIEEAGADIDEELVNKVYRTAHSIKGGAGFMGLDNIKDLTHEMENILGKIRSREMVPNPEIINILLLAADEVRNLINNVFTSNDVDISQHLESLKMISEGATLSEGTGDSEADDDSQDNIVSESAEASEDALLLTEEDIKPSISIAGIAEVKFPDRKVSFSVTIDDLSSARDEGKFIYLVEIDLIKDDHIKDKNPGKYLMTCSKQGVSSIVKSILKRSECWVKKSFLKAFLYL